MCWGNSWLSSGFFRLCQIVDDSIGLNGAIRWFDRLVRFDGQSVAYLSSNLLCLISYHLFAWFLIPAMAALCCRNQCRTGCPAKSEMVVCARRGSAHFGLARSSFSLFWRCLVCTVMLIMSHVLRCDCAHASWPCAKRIGEDVDRAVPRRGGPVSISRWLRGVGLV